MVDIAAGNEQEKVGCQKRIAIIGLGLIGGSLGLALKRRVSEQVYITGSDCSQEVMDEALRAGAVDAIAPLPDCVQDAEMVILCTPVLQIETVLRAILPKLKPGTVLTDVGSTKTYLLQRFRRLLPPYIHYVGGHPMAGREKSGITAADAGLFQGKWFLVIPDEAAETAVAQVRWLAESVGAKIAEMQADTHDRCAAIISHVPHIAAASMVNLLADYPDADSTAKLAAGGFCDTTRIASSDPDMWADICLSNEEAICDSLEQLEAWLRQVRQGIRAGDRQMLHRFFSRAKAYRDKI